MTFAAVLNRYKGLGPGFDFLRIFLASLIVVTHSFFLSGNGEFFRGTPLWFIEYALVPMFFALSGFLVTGSAQRLSLGNFLINRGLRILPALGVDIILCTLILGPLLTTFPLSVYFSDSRFFQYFLNVTGWIHYSLPGVFGGQVSEQVNGALWTVPYEMLCYALMSGLIITRFIGNPVRVAILIVAMLAIGCFFEQVNPGLPRILDKTVNMLFVSRGAQLLVAFLLGTLFFQLKDRIPYSKAVFAACCAICLIAALTLPSMPIGQVANRIVLLPVLTYMTVFLGLTPVPLPSLLKSGDYSYGVYLYHDPLLQTIITFLPTIVHLPKIGAVALALMGLPAVALLAAFSWHLIEKPILGLRKKFSFVARVRGVDGHSVPDAHERAAKLVARPLVQSQD